MLLPTCIITKTLTVIFALEERKQVFHNRMRKQGPYQLRKLYFLIIIKKNLEDEKNIRSSSLSKSLSELLQF